MVSGKVKSVFGFQKTPPHPEQQNPNLMSSCSSLSSSYSSQKSFPLPVPSSPPPTKTVFSRSFGVYFPRSKQVQPRPPEVIDLVRLVDELREKVSRLSTELVEQKLLKETVKIVPFLESEISSKNADIALSQQRIVSLETKNATLRREIGDLKERMEREGVETEKKVKEMEDEIAELKKALELKTRIAETEECSSTAERTTSTLWKRSTQNVDPRNVDSILEKQEVEMTDPKGKEEQGRTLETIKTVTNSKVPRVPKPPPLPTFSASSSPAIKIGKSRASLENASMTKPPAPLTRVSEGCTIPPPPPVPTTRSLNAGKAKVRRVPEVAELYHSLMRRDSRKESYVGVQDTTPASNARDMIGEIENRSAYLLAVSNALSSSSRPISTLVKFTASAMAA